MSEKQIFRKEAMKAISSPDQVRKFMKVLQTDLRVQRLARSLRAPETDEEAIESYVRLAAASGFTISREEMAKGLESLAQEKREQSAAAEKATGRLEEEELDRVVGGYPGAWYPAYCKDQFVENQWCWYADSCTGVINNYSDVIDELGKRNSKEG